MAHTISELNQMSQSTFVEIAGAIFEDTPAIAAQAWTNRPFVDVDDLHQKMVEVVNHLNPAEQLALICAHPDLGSRAKMAEASVKEQAGVGLDRLTPQEYDRVQSLNQSYRVKFGFPFIVAVKNYTKDSILAAFEHRLQNSVETEKQQALAEIAEIAKFRLMNLVAIDDRSSYTNRFLEG
ncbi:MAG: 2-oxo-4-hydroxy-4-carboxy-5-ureidoimidazoline decarboxylase [Cyanobacteria bacterium RU_5_0]|nr:2-oxo-4-hydroxy-4-carboxy-5-ureidoimidazoline decarboxylase [Cyanobacteria bacterium RU_5_0]